MTARALDSIGKVGGPRCCKRDSWLACLLYTSAQADGAFVAELNKEIGQDHFLYGKKILAVAKCESNDDVLYVLRNGTGRDIYYLFHLTYSAHNADGFPQYEEFADLFAVKEFIERSYIEDYM